jgi:hypothetical protein
MNLSNFPLRNATPPKLDDSERKIKESSKSKRWGSRIKANAWDHGVSL